MAEDAQAGPAPHQQFSMSSNSPPQLSTLLPHLPQFVGLIDVESLAGRSVPILSEVCMVICRVTVGRGEIQSLGSEHIETEPGSVCSRLWSTGPLRMIETYHRVLLPPSWCNVSEDTTQGDTIQQINHVSHYVTGLHYGTLMEAGIHYHTMQRELQQTIDRYPGIQLLARDPRLENQLLRRTDVGEVCSYLHAPLNQAFLQRTQRPLRIKAECAQRFTCQHHHPLSDQRASLHPHCAQADCMEMLAWLQMWGQLTDIPRMSEPRFHPQQILTSVIQVDRCFPEVNISPLPPPSPPSFFPFPTQTHTSPPPENDTVDVNDRYNSDNYNDDYTCHGDDEQSSSHFDLTTESWPQLGTQPPVSSVLNVMPMLPLSASHAHGAWVASWTSGEAPGPPTQSAQPSHI